MPNDTPNEKSQDVRNHPDKEHNAPEQEDKIKRGIDIEPEAEDDWNQQQPYDRSQKSPN
ncbi:hypothetical protein J31TS4_10330 [Paenibacillus sp. J31TS4]|uniref:hypothetical protein n=1 Tax=Paenibacillus sp. J31TS4 TaxID=2807195 RepID=UPI001B20DE3C|nr:hypothetical protein [Paenibacillus sp. J31TS4]GIP37753.1 hypothetical protein J31TS4_10330 [Paenibacillus sp. J31TS4]